jgi:hypothetical protein
MWDTIHAALLAKADALGRIDWAVSVDSTIDRAHQHAATLPRTTGSGSNHTNLLLEPPDHGIGRSRGGLSTKIHQLVDGRPPAFDPVDHRACDVVERAFAHLKRWRRPGPSSFPRPGAESDGPT